MPLPPAFPYLHLTGLERRHAWRVWKQGGGLEGNGYLTSGNSLTPTPKGAQLQLLLSTAKTANGEKSTPKRAVGWIWAREDTSFIRLFITENMLKSGAKHALTVGHELSDRNKLALNNYSTIMRDIRKGFTCIQHSKTSFINTKRHAWFLYKQRKKEFSQGLNKILALKSAAYWE